MVEGRRLSADFAEKAESDLELAQHIATLVASGRRGKAREAGYALGTCMYHAQQALEKRLKAVVLLLDETLGVPYGRVNALLAKDLGHPVYPAMLEYYSGRLGLLLPAGTPPDRGGGAPGGGGAAAALGHRTANLRSLCGFWNRHSRDYEWQLNSWRRSVGLGLEAEAARDLEFEHKAYAGLLEGLTGHAALDPFLLGGPLPTVSPGECLDGGALGRRRAEHAGGAQASGLSVTLDREFRKCRTAARVSGGGSLAARDARIRKARRAVLDFGLTLLLCHSVPYMALLPHNTLGRYPEWLGGTTTADLYGRQAGHVLHYLFVSVPHISGQMSDYSGRIGSLWEGVAGP
ncbi:MAG: hypothetical protein OXU25_05190 [Thaumarchaeota archaeon]|nr:hypothetical protein [Nitrososphaerota archaeon]